MSLNLKQLLKIDPPKLVEIDRPIRMIMVRPIPCFLFGSTTGSEQKSIKSMVKRITDSLKIS